MTEDELTAQAAVLQNAASALEQEVTALENSLAMLENVLRSIDVRGAKQKLAQVKLTAANTKRVVQHHFDQQQIQELQARAEQNARRQQWEQEQQDNARIMRDRAQNEFRKG